MPKLSGNGSSGWPFPSIWGLVGAPLIGAGVPEWPRLVYIKGQERLVTLTFFFFFFNIYSNHKHTHIHTLRRCTLSINYNTVKQNTLAPLAKETGHHQCLRSICISPWFLFPFLWPQLDTLTSYSVTGFPAEQKSLNVSFFFCLMVYICSLNIALLRHSNAAYYRRNRTENECGEAIKLHTCSNTSCPLCSLANRDDLWSLWPLLVQTGTSPVSSSSVW